MAELGKDALEVAGDRRFRNAEAPSQRPLVPRTSKDVLLSVRKRMISIRRKLARNYRIEL